MATFIFEVDPKACIAKGLEPQNRYEAKIDMAILSVAERATLADLTTTPESIGLLGVGWRVSGLVLPEASPKAAFDAIAEETERRGRWDAEDSAYLAAYTQWATAKEARPKTCHVRGYRDVPYTVRRYQTPAHPACKPTESRRYPARLDAAVYAIREALGVEQWKRDLAAGNRIAQALAARVAWQDNGYDEPLLTAGELAQMGDDTFQCVTHYDSEDQLIAGIVAARRDSLKQPEDEAAWATWEIEKAAKREAQDLKVLAGTAAWRTANGLTDDGDWLAYIEETRHND